MLLRTFHHATRGQVTRALHRQFCASPIRASSLELSELTALGGIDGATNTLGLDGGSVGYTGVTMENEGEATVGPSLSGRYYSWQEEFGLSRK